MTFVQTLRIAVAGTDRAEHFDPFINVQYGVFFVVYPLDADVARAGV